MSNSENNSPENLDASLKVTRDKINAVSPSFCLAKWLQVTMHLQNGQTHSCHHPMTHQVPLEELQNNKTALHNTNLKKELRRQMLKGERPAECDYCWNIEGLGTHLTSDRHIKSSDPWALPELEKIATAPWDADVNPTYVEVSFSSVCNFKCAYCLPHISTKWMNEIQEFGPYPTRHKHNNLELLKTQNLMPLSTEEENPYVKSFWEWWPELYPTLKVFRITGGEPLLSASTFKVLDHIIENPNPKLELVINSNLGVPNEIVEKFSKKIETIRSGKKVRQISVYTSLDTWGSQAEYIRHGLKLELFKKNLETIYAINPRVEVIVMCSFNLLSLFNFQGLLDFVTEQRDLGRRMQLDISYVRHPQFLDCRLLPQSWKEKSSDLLTLMENKFFLPYESLKMTRLIEYIKSPVSPDFLAEARQDFVSFIEEHDRRRNTDFLGTFPEFKEDFADWKKIQTTS